MLTKRLTRMKKSTLISRLCITAEQPVLATEA